MTDAFAPNVKTVTTILAVVAGFIATGTAFADEKQTSRDLPGVDTEYSIVQPAPEPDDRSAEEVRDDRLHFKAGNWDVRVSGYVSVEIGASSYKGR